MRYKTSEEVLDYICSLAENSSVAEAITGKVYQDGLRPRDSEKEDLVVVYTSGVADGELVRGELTFNLYVQDIQPYRNGVYVKDSRRLSELSGIFQEWIASLRYGISEYKLTQLEPIRTEEDRDLNQHFLILHVQYEYCLIN